MIVVADTSVLVNLCRVGQGGLFQSLFREVVIPPEVAAEFVALTVSVPRFGGLSLPEGIRQQAPAAKCKRASVGASSHFLNFPVFSGLGAGSRRERKRQGIL